MKSFQFKWIIDHTSEGMLLRQFLLEKKHISRQALTDIKFHGGNLYVNDQSVTVRYELKLSDVVKVIFPPERISESMVPEKMDLNILYEDEHFLAIDKPAHMPTIPSQFHPSSSLAQGILYYFQKHGIPSTIHIINRLDRDTSGIVMVAKHRYAHSLLSRSQRNGELKRTYIALCHGSPIPSKGSIEEPIGRKDGSIIERCVTGDGQYAKTHFEVMESFEEYALIRLRLETGRTHQIRVHMAHIGHPLLGDDLYGGTRDSIQRQALHSRSLRFYHPFNEQTITIEAPLPLDIRTLIHGK